MVKTVLRPFGKLTSSSHMRIVRHFGSKSEDLGNAVLRKVGIIMHDLFITHPFGQTTEDERNGKARPPNRGLATEPIRVANDPLVSRN